MNCRILVLFSLPNRKQKYFDESWFQPDTLLLNEITGQRMKGL